MQDKEFDKLFSSKLEGLEIEPSASVWPGINNDLGNGRRKKLIPYLSIAASIIILMAAGVLFIPKKQVAVKSPVKTNVAVIKQQVFDMASTVKKQQVIAPKTLMIAAVKPVYLYHIKQVNTQVKAEKTDNIAKEESPVQPVEKQGLVASGSVKADIKPATMDSAKLIAATAPVIQQQDKRVSMDSSLPSANKQINAAPVKKHKIHGIGDLLNVAIAAVDKRKDKIIEFSDGDGDGTTVTGVNLGIIKIKKEN